MTTVDEEIGALSGADAEAVVVPAPVPTETDDWSGLARDDPRLYLNRELAELQFQFRVLFEAIDERNPLLERIRFLGLLTRNVDEFCMKRIGGLKQQMAGEVSELTADGRTPQEQWGLALQRLRELYALQDRWYHRLIDTLHAETDIRLVDVEALEVADAERLRAHFEAEILPTLTPLSFDPAHPFPFISNRSVSMAIRTSEDGADEWVFSRIKLPENQPRLVAIDPIIDAAGHTTTFVYLEDLIASNLDLLFPNVSVQDWSMFRVLRNAEVGRSADVAEGLIEMIEGVLRDRRFATVVTLEVASDMPRAVRELLTRELGMEDAEVFERTAPIDARHLQTIAALDRPKQQPAPFYPRPHPRLQTDQLDEPPRSIFAQIREGDILVHHPYHSFEKTVQRFIREAASDEDVLAIKAAIYRTSEDSQFVEHLIAAARNGKQVAVMVELKARFDEANNLRWVERLEEEGIHVAYGTIGLKTHSKTALVVREEPDGVQLYSHVGTGNYHAETAKGYVDLGLLTTDTAIGQDLTRLFHFFTGHAAQEDYRKLLVAPSTLRSGLTDRIRATAAAAAAGRSAAITAKMNALEDPAIIAELYDAAAAGVRIDLYVRDICRLRPGLEGVSESISVKSVVGHFLEHSRIVRFTVEDSSEYLIGSADWMTRNLDRRVEAVTPIDAPRLQRRLDAILDAYAADTRNSWEMLPDGGYRKQLAPEEHCDVQATFMRRAMAGREDV